MNPGTDYTALIVTGVGTATLTFLAGLFGAWIQSRREIRKWQMQLRYEAYRAVLVESDFLHLGVQRSGETVRFTAGDKQKGAEAVAALALVGPAKLYRLAIAYQTQAVDLLDVAHEATAQEWGEMMHARNALAVAMQKALRVPRGERFKAESVEEYVTLQEHWDATRQEQRARLREATSDPDEKNV